MERDMGGSSQVAVIIVRLTKEETVTRLYRVFFIFFIIFLEFFFFPTPCHCGSPFFSFNPQKSILCILYFFFFCVCLFIRNSSF